MIKTLTRWFWICYFLSISFKKSPFICKWSFNTIQSNLHFIWTL